MSPKQLSQPVIEPVSLDEMKAHLKLDHSNDDLMLSAFLIAARVHLENATKRHFITQSWRLELSIPAATSLSLPVQPVQHVLSAALLSKTGDIVALDLADFRLQTHKSPATLQILGPNAWLPGNLLRIDLETGFGPNKEDVPAPIRQAIKMLTAEWYERRLVADPATLPKLNAALTTLLTPYRVMRLH